MRLVRFIAEGETEVRTGEWLEDAIAETTGLFADRLHTGKRFRADKAVLQAPVAPRHIIGIMANFGSDGEKERASGREEPQFFLKSPDTIVGPNRPVVIPAGLDLLSFEAELAVVIGKPTFGIEARDVEACILGYAIANDLTAGGYAHPGGNIAMTKVSPTLTPLGPWIETNPQFGRGTIASFVNGEQRQRGEIGRMKHSIARQIAYIAERMRLGPGDVLLTGAPPNAGQVRRGDEVVCEIEGLGRLTNPVE
ncbi:fumarylacetoacetate hydrolase family protein [Cohnella sp. GCM10020058]|uniref:fumarylacetoacetate hydrolase family protein n=1 Tax=Cohnella sp. GCM10020058 TaxID=3317330 RepID=UPI003643EC8B